MDSLELAAASNVVVEKFLANESLTSMHKGSFNGSDGDRVADYGCLRPPEKANLQSGVSGAGAPVTSNFKAIMAPPSTNKQNNWKLDRSMTLVGRILEAENQPVDPAQATVKIETTKDSGGKGNRCKNASRKRSRSSQMFCLKDGGDVVNKSGTGSGEGTENVKTKTRRRTSSQISRKGDKRPSVRVAADLPRKHGLFPDVNSASRTPCILDIYGLKTRQVYLDRYMSELPLEDLLAGNVSSCRKVGASHCDKEPFLMQINHILEQLPKWPGGCRTAPKVSVSLSPHALDEEKSSTLRMSLPSFVKIRDEAAVETQKIIHVGETNQDANHVQVGQVMTKRFSVDTLPLKFFEVFISSLKLPPSQSLETLIARGTADVDPGFAEPCTLVSNNFHDKSHKMPPFSFSLPMSGRSKTDMLQEKDSTRCKSFQDQQIQTRMRVKDDGILKSSISAHEFQVEHIEPDTINSMGIKSQLFKCKKEQVEQRDVKNIQVPVQERYRTLDACQRLGNRPMGTSNANTMELSSQSGGVSDVVFLEDDAIKKTEGKITSSAKLYAEEFSHSNKQQNVRSDCCENRFQNEELRSSADLRILEQPEVHLSSKSYFMTTEEKGKCQEKDFQTHAHLLTFCGEPATDATAQGKYTATSAATHDTLFPWLRRYCINCSSKLSTIMPAQLVAPSVLEASILLHHMANCTSAIELFKVRKGRGRALQGSPSTLVQRTPKNLKLGPLTESNAASSGVEPNQMTSKLRGVLTFNHKPSGCERRKSLSEVGDFVQVPTANKAGTSESKDFKSSDHILGCQNTIRSSKSGKQSAIFPRENSSLTGKGASSYKHFPNVNQSLVAKNNTLSLPTTQRSLFIGPTHGGGGGNKHPKDCLRGTPLKITTQTFTSLADSRSRAKQGSARGKLSRS